MKARGVLVLSRDPLAAALIGAATELAGFEARYPSSTENPREALLRTRPRVVVVDCDHEAASESFFGPALMAGAQIAVFSSPRSERASEPIAESYRIRTLRLPVDVEVIGRLLDECVRDGDP